jgi:glycosyltransferase involved in cell wall biosynthesis
LQRLASDGRVVALLSRLAGGVAQPDRRLAFYCGVEDFHFPGTARLLTLTWPRPDIVHCHNLHGDYFDLRMLPWLSQQVPLVLTLHDAWLLSGHCAHSFGCEKWKIGCGHCPDLTIYPALHRDATAHNWRRKREIYTRSRLYVATPSRWLMQKVEQSMLALAVVEARVLPNGVDLSVFHPADRREARAALGIPQDVKVLLVTGVQLRQNIWKDYSTLRDAVALTSERLYGEGLLLIALGEDAPPERIGQAEIRSIPYQADRATVARYYQAADVYVHAARADTFPNAVLEALACGRPVVATAVGGIPEQVDDTRTGFLVSAGDAQGLAARIMQVLSDDALQQGMGMQAAQTARQQFDFDRQVDAYLNWYAELVMHRS